LPDLPGKCWMWKPIWEVGFLQVLDPPLCACSLQDVAQPSLKALEESPLLSLQRRELRPWQGSGLPKGTPVDGAEIQGRPVAGLPGRG
jgi:hypothetical protein